MAPPSEVQVRGALQAVTDQATADSVAVLRLAGSLDDVIVTVPGIIEVYSDAAAAIAAEHYDELRDAARATGSFRALTVVEVREEQIRRGLLWSAQPLIADPGLSDLTVVESRLASVVSAETARPFRDTILANTEADPASVGWSRHCKVDGCKFCRMLASRGAVYRSDRALFASHPRCSCTAVPVFRGESIGPEADVLQYTASQRRRTPADQERLRRHLAQMDDRVGRAPPPPRAAVPDAPKPIPDAPDPSARVGGKVITADDPRIVAEARRRNLDPVKLADQREAKRVARLEQRAADRIAARELTVDSPEVLRLADRYGVTPDDILAARARVGDVRRAISSEAAETVSDMFDRLYQWNATKVRNPSTFTGRRPPEYDWLERLHPAEVQRLRRKWFDLSPDSPPPDVFVELLGQADPTLAGASIDDGIAEWLDVNRRYEAANALRRGKLPSERAYSGELDPATLVPRLTDEGYDVVRILGTDDLEAAAHIARVETDLIRRDAYDYLQTATNPRHGPSPYRMSFQAWEEEVRDLEAVLRDTLVRPSSAQLDRYRELIPEALDDPALSFEDVYARIVSTARQAGEDVPDYAIIPWS